MPEIESGKTWQGLNRRVDEVDLPPDQSPDTTNADIKDSKLGQLAARPGVEFLGDNAFSDKVVGYFPFELATGPKVLIPTADGLILELDKFDSAPSTDFLNTDGNITSIAGAGTLTASAGFPSTLDTASAELIGGTTSYDANASLLFRLKMFESSTSGGIRFQATPATTTFSFQFTGGVLLDDPTREEREMFKLEFETDSGLDVAHHIQAGEGGYAYFVPDTGTIRGAFFKVELQNGWPPGTSSGNVSAFMNTGVSTDGLG